MYVEVYPWSDPEYEDGLGFGMGSTSGVVNKYMYRGFQRPSAPQPSKAARDAFNLRGCKGAYACHFDPEFDVRINEHPLPPALVPPHIPVWYSWLSRITKRQSLFIVLISIIMLVLVMKFTPKN